MNLRKGCENILLRECYKIFSLQSCDHASWTTRVLCRYAEIFGSAPEAVASAIDSRYRAEAADTRCGKNVSDPPLDLFAHHFALA